MVSRDRSVYMPDTLRAGETSVAMTGEGETTIDEAAIAWFVLLRDEAATAEDRARFGTWLDADLRNRRAWDEVSAMWSGIDSLAPARPAPLRPLHQAQRPRPWGWLAAAAILVLVGGPAFWILQPAGFAAGLLADHRTGPEHGETVTLADGSIVALGPSSALSVDFDGAARRVTLHQGEGYFTVTPDTSHPFIVEAAEGTVKVVGTEFDVKLADERVAVAVASGVVEVAAGNGDAVQLVAGQSVRYDDAGTEAVATVDPADVGFWRSGRLVFQATPLGEVLQDLERYRHGRIIVTDAAIAALPVTGVFDTRRTDAALDTIARTLPVRLMQVTDLFVLVGPAQ